MSGLRAVIDVSITVVYETRAPESASVMPSGKKNRGLMNVKPCVRLAVGVVFLFAVSACAKQETDSPSAQAVASSPPIESFATTRQVMLGLTIPASDVLFQAGSAAPADDAGWEKVQANAAMLAESANLLLTAPRVIDSTEWKGFAQSLLTTSKAALAAAQARNVYEVLEAGNQIYEACDGCHKKYMAARAGE